MRLTGEDRDGVLRYDGELHPTDCKLCDCAGHRSALGTGMTREDPVFRCICGHPTSRHRFRPYRVDTAKRQEEDR